MEMVSRKITVTNPYKVFLARYLLVNVMSKKIVESSWTIVTVLLAKSVLNRHERENGRPNTYGIFRIDKLNIVELTK